LNVGNWQSATRFHAFRNAGTVKASTLKEKASRANKRSDDESSNLDPDGFDKWHEKAALGAWGSKSPADKVKASPTTWPRAVLVVDRTISVTQEFVAQMRGIIATKGYTVTTVCLDHFSGLSFTNL
jgi:hypothetical protein